MYMFMARRLSNKSKLISSWQWNMKKEFNGIDKSRFVVLLLCDIRFSCRGKQAPKRIRISAVFRVTYASGWKIDTYATHEKGFIPIRAGNAAKGIPCAKRHGRKRIVVFSDIASVPQKRQEQAPALRMARHFRSNAVSFDRRGGRMTSSHAEEWQVSLQQS